MKTVQENVVQLVKKLIELTERDSISWKRDGGAEVWKTYYKNQRIEVAGINTPSAFSIDDMDVFGAKFERMFGPSIEVFKKMGIEKLLNTLLGACKENFYRKADRERKKNTERMRKKIANLAK
ncbi:MAG: hypothetical protein PHT40_04395 [Patescibacteria group bacterium]|nr:hypothetical protein [Patescibacteria group bacterium]